MHTILFEDKIRTVYFISEKIILSIVQDALDLMIAAQEKNAGLIILNKENISSDFFNLGTGFAGEVLQKFMNYNMKFAVIGDFCKLSSNFKAFILECNRGTQFMFADTIEIIRNSRISVA